MTTITIERAVIHRALSALEYHTQQTRPIHNTELVIEELKSALSAPATAPSHTEAEVQELLHDDREMTEERFEISVRRILGVPAP